MALARKAAETVTQVIARVRLETGDAATDADGNPITFPRWSDTVITSAFNDHLVECQTILQIQSSAEGLLYVDTGYGASAERIDLPPGINASPIFAVDDVTDPLVLRPITMCSPAEIEIRAKRWPLVFADMNRYWCLEETSGGAFELKIRPMPSAGLTIRIRYYGTALVSDGTGGDAPLLTDRWAQFAGLGSARILLSRDDEVPAALEARFQEQKAEYIQLAKRMRGPQRVRRSRRAIA